MARIKIELPGSFPFSCQIPVRITDINYGGHAGNDTVLSIIHEARMQFLQSMGYSEMEFAGVGMIMSDVGIEFKNELFYGDIIIASVVAGEISRVGFDLLYKLETLRPANNDRKVLVAAAKTRMVCYNYEKKKIVSVPAEARVKLEH
ncbi:MAG TPA: thioesterase family protein [Chitinophagaceae bacterium]|nr:thioesterase family protein [Chitinophagaceae bacterium]